MLQASRTLLNREGVSAQTIEVGLLTDGSSYLPTPSQWFNHQWCVRWRSSPLTVARP